MSNHLAIATVTATLHRIILEALQRDQDGLSFDVWTHRPNDVPKAKAGVNVHLYQVSPNPHWRNADAPTRRADGSLTQRPQAALDLSYIISFFGDDTRLEPQRLLGTTVKALHARPVLGREMVRKVVALSKAAAAPNNYLKDSDLASQVELVRISPLTLGLEEVGKLWSAFQTSQVLSVCYQASVVLVESNDATPAPALPVRAVGVAALASAPEIRSVVAEAGEGAPIVAGATIVVRGRGLRAQGMRVLVNGHPVPPASATDEEVRLSLAHPALPKGAVKLGVNRVQVQHQVPLGDPPTPHHAASSEEHPFLVRPSILPKEGGGHHVTPGPKLADAQGNYTGTITVRTLPLVDRHHRVTLMLDGITEPGRAYAFDDDGRGSDGFTQLGIPVRRVKPGKYLVRLRVDGLDSPLGVKDGAYATPEVVIP